MSESTAIAVATTVTTTPWVERYRPKNLKEVSHQNEVVSTLQNAVATGRLPHLLFYGPPGTGKTSVALALCRQLWAPTEWRRRVLELNASDERGISVVRDKIKHFASLAVGGGSGKHKNSSSNAFFQKKKATKNDDNNDDDAMDVDGEENEQEETYPNPPFKVIILDEADTVTPDAQAALRRIIEAYSRITRFILICNYVTRIIEPLASRCAKFRFQPLPPASMKERLTTIARSENCSVDHLDQILSLAQGDMRRAVTTLQSVQALSAAGPIDKDTLAEVAGLPPPTVVDNLWNSMDTFGSMQSAVENVCAEGFSATGVLKAISTKVLDDTTLSELSKAKLAIRVAEVEKNLIDGADEYLQLMTVCSLALTCFQETKKQ